MPKSILKELQEELRNIREGKSIVELDEDRSQSSSRSAKAFVEVKISKRTFNRLNSIARKKKLSLPELLDEIARRTRPTYQR